MSPKAEGSSDGITQVVGVPKEVFNADSVFLVEWLVDNGSSVEPGSSLCEIETSKSTVVVEAEQGGYVRQVAKVGEEVDVGGILGYVTRRPDTSIPSSAVKGDGDSAGPRISAKAQMLIDRLGLDVSLFGDRALVREKDVFEFIEGDASGAAVVADPRGSSTVRSLGPVQRRVAILMERSAVIPVSYLEKTIDLEPVRTAASEASKANHNMVTVLDALVAAVAQTCPGFPQFNGFLNSEYQLRSFDAVHVALAVEVERDLFVVVVRDAATKEVGTIAKELRGLEYKAHRRRLDAAEMVGGNDHCHFTAGAGGATVPALALP